MQWTKYCWGAIEKKSILLLHYWKILHFVRAPKNIFLGAPIIYSSTLQRWQSFRKLHKGQGVWDGHVGYLMKLNIIGWILRVAIFLKFFFKYVLVTLLNLTCNRQKYYWRTIEKNKILQYWAPLIFSSIVQRWGSSAPSRKPL